MTVLRCTARLLTRLKQPAKLPEPEPQANPLGEWYADIDLWRRRPFVVMLNAATGAVLALPGDAASLRRLHERALLQFAASCAVHGLHGEGVDAELRGFDAGFTFANTRNRSLLGSLNERKFGLWMALEHTAQSLPEAAARDWGGLFKRPVAGRTTRHSTDYHRPSDLLRERLSSKYGLA